MAKATTTIRQSLQYQPQHAAWFATTQSLFNRVAAFYFEVIQAHEGVLALSNKDALSALEILTHASKDHPTPLIRSLRLPRTSLPCFGVPPSMRRSAPHDP